jgi:uncharacterized linocin/CFP29 family protein
VNHLLRGHAPISDAAWDMLDDEARERLSAALGARKVVDFSGPHGWEFSATNLGRAEPLGSAPAEGVTSARRRVLPVAELRAPFTVARAELAAADRGALDLDLDALDEAALCMGRAENVAVFHGFEEAGMVGITQASPHPPIARTGEPDRYASHVAKAAELLLRSGIDGPYGLALSPDDYTSVIETSEHGGYPLFDHLRQILRGGPIVWAPGVRGAVVMSTRGGDFLFASGQDLAIGYDHHDADSVHLYLEQSFTFWAVEPDAAVAIEPPG